MQDKKVHLHEWDGKVLKEITTLTGNRGVVSALAFSPDGALLSAGDVGVLVCLVKSYDTDDTTSRAEQLSCLMSRSRR
jgi:WD40 repeat protein